MESPHLPGDNPDFFLVAVIDITCRSTTYFFKQPRVVLRYAAGKLLILLYARRTIKCPVHWITYQCAAGPCRDRPESGPASPMSLQVCSGSRQSATGAARRCMAQSMRTSQHPVYVPKCVFNQCNFSALQQLCVSIIMGITRAVLTRSSFHFHHI